MLSNLLKTATTAGFAADYIGSNEFVESSPSSGTPYNTYTFSGINLGNLPTKIFAVLIDGAGLAVNVSSATIAGVSARVYIPSDVDTAWEQLAFIVVTGLSATTGDVVLNFTGNINSSTAYTSRLYLAKYHTNSEDFSISMTSNQSAFSVVSNGLNVPGTFVIGAVCGGSTSSGYQLTGVNQDAIFIDTGPVIQVGSKLVANTTTVGTVSYTPAFGSIGCVTIYPAPIETIADIWLNAASLSALPNNTEVTSWSNQGSSGSTYDASGSTNTPIKTTYGGVPVLQFDSSTNLVLEMANEFSLTTGTLFIVGYQTSSRMIGFGGAASNGNCFWGYSGNNGVSVLLRNTSDGGYTGSSLTSVVGLKAFGFVKTGTTAAAIFDNVTIPTTVSAISGNYLFKKIGTRDYSGSPNSQPSTGYLAEVLYFNSALNNADARAVMEKLKSRNLIA